MTLPAPKNADIFKYIDDNYRKIGSEDINTGYIGNLKGQRNRIQIVHYS